MAYENPIEDDLPTSRGRGFGIMIALALVAALGAYLGGYLPQFDVLLYDAHSNLLAHNDQIINVLANGAPFLFAGVALLFLRKVIRRATAHA